MSTPSSLTSPPPPQTFALISFPTPQILLVTFNRPQSLNCISTPSNWELDALFAWYDNEPSLRCCVVTGMGRAFCAGADLKEWNERNEQMARTGAGAGANPVRVMPVSGFGALSRRSGKKPVIGAVNGIAFGGGMEIVTNLDLVVAATGAVFALPEVKRGVVALAGALPRLVRTVGKPRAMEIALTGRTVSADEAREWGIVNAVTADAPADAAILSRPVVQKALEYAKEICDNSPDSVIVSRAGIIAGWEDGSAEHATTAIRETWDQRLNEGENIHEGVKAFVEKRAPRWVGSKL